MRNERYVIGICGSTGADGNTYDGQTVKTRNVIDGLLAALGSNSVAFVNTHYWKTKPLSTFFKCVKLAFSCDKILIMPAQRGLRVFLPLFYLIKKVAKNKLYYSVIGGWLPEILQKSKYLIHICKGIDCIFPETNTMMHQLCKLGLDNTVVVPTAKKLSIVNVVQKDNAEIKKVIFFSRVIEQKGIYDIIRVVDTLNKLYGKTVCRLDIYGMVGEEEKEKFSQIIDTSPDYIQYFGVAKPECSVEIMKSYFLHVFPTKFQTEGLPSSIIDAMCAGVPSIVSEWNSAREFIIDGVNGLVYAFNDIEELQRKLDWALNNPEAINAMKTSCIDEAQRYSIDSIIKKMMDEMGLS